MSVASATSSTSTAPRANAKRSSRRRSLPAHRIINVTGWYALRKSDVDVWIVAYVRRVSVLERGVEVLGPAESAAEAAGLTPMDDRPVRFETMPNKHLAKNTNPLAGGPA